MDVKSLNFSTTGLKGCEAELGILAQRIVDFGCAPAVSIRVSQRRPEGWARSSAAAGRTGRSSATVSTPFDLASVTKPVMAILATELAASQVLKLADPIAKWLPELKPTAFTTRASFESVLAHRSGLPSHRILFDELHQKRAIYRSRMLQRAVECAQIEQLELPRDRVAPATYSDLGYLVVGAALERAYGRDLDLAVAERVAEPLESCLGSSRQWRARCSNFQELVAPTETIAWRGGQLRGVVHDENAWAWAGYGAAGHAGLFGTSLDVARVGEAMIDSLLGRPSPISRFTALVTTGYRERGTLRAGFDGVSVGRSSAGSRISRLAFGHLGFTGTSIWCDPLNELVLVVLTNRVCPSRNNSLLPQSRSQIHDWLFDWAVANKRRS